MTKPMEVKQEVPIVTRTTSNSYSLKESAIVKWSLDYDFIALY